MRENTQNSTHIAQDMFAIGGGFVQVNTRPANHQPAFAVEGGSV